MSRSKLPNPNPRADSSNSSYLLQRLVPEAWCQPWALKCLEHARIQLTTAQCESIIYFKEKTTVSTLENPQRSWHLFHFRSRFFCLLLNSLQPAWPALRAPPTSPIAESRLILANAMGPSNFPTWLPHVFLGFSPSLSVAINLKCFVILSDVVLSACAWEYTVHIPAKKTKVRLFLDRAIFQQDNHLSSSVPQLHSHVNILKRRCAVSHLIALSENVSLSLV